jgi:hypothetical protein
LDKDLNKGLEQDLDKDLETKPPTMFLIGSAMLMCHHATTMYLSTIIMCLSAIVMYGLELILFNHAIIPVGSAIVEDRLQLFLATLNLFLYLNREGLLVGEGFLEYPIAYLSRNLEGFVRSTFLFPIKSF